MAVGAQECCSRLYDGGSHAGTVGLRMKVILAVVVLAILVIAALVAAFVPLMGVTSAETVPYVVTEDYYRTEFVTTEVPLAFEAEKTDPPFINIYWTPLSECSVAVHNADDQWGLFRVEFTVMTEQRDEITKVLWQGLDAGERKVAVVRIYEGHTKSFDYSVTPPTKEVIDLVQVLDTRDVTKYRTVEKADKVSVLEYLRDWR
jgi:hypothetical protein